MTFDDLVAQLAHIGWGALLLENLCRVMPWGWAALLVAMFALTKELIESIWGVWEPVQDWNSCSEDCLAWCFGILLGTLLVSI